MNRPARHPRTTLVQYAFALSCTITLVTGVILVATDHTVTTREILTAIGLNLMAAVVFAVIFTALSSWVQQRSLEDSINERLETMSRNILGKMGAMNDEFLPIASYAALEPEKTYGDPFNMDMTDSLEKTRFYAFRGPSPLYMIPRLRAARRRPQEVRVAMLSPGDRRAIECHTPERIFWARSKDKTITELQDELRDEIIMTIVSIFDYRTITPVSILYIEETAVFRSEMFDDCVFISWYLGPNSPSKEMPESFRFSMESFTYQTLRSDLERRFDISPNRVRFDATQDDDFLRAHLDSHLGSVPGGHDLGAIRENYEAQTAHFSAYLEEMYGRRRNNQRHS